MFNMIAWPVQLGLYGGEVFAAETPLMDDSNPLILLAAFGTTIVAGLWSVVVGLKVFGEVNRFSAWRSLASGALVAAIIGMVLLVVAAVAFVAFGGRPIL